jgi:hypothetical protein
MLKDPAKINSNDDLSEILGTNQSCKHKGVDLLTIILLSHNCDEKLELAIQKFINVRPNSCVLYIADSGFSRKIGKFAPSDFGESILLQHGLCNGIYNSINWAIERISTEYYMVLGLDDNFDFKLAEPFVNKLENRQVDLLFCGVIKNNKKLMYLRPEFTLKGPQGVFPSHTGGVAIRTRLHERFGKYDERFTVVADLFFLGKCIIGGAKAELHNEYLAEIGGSGFSKKHEFTAEIESMRVRVELGASYLESGTICVQRLARRAIKRLIFRVFS